MVDKELLDYFDGDDLAAKVWQDKYALEGETSPTDTIKRLAKEFSRIEKTFRVDIFMNWKERRPSKAKRNKEQILD